MEIATETIGNFTKDVDGETKPKWERYEVNEIVISQVTRLIIK